jgi:hypothetical protein
MSSQNDPGIPIFHVPDGIGYRLMELPPELLEALESANPPESVRTPVPRTSYPGRLLTIICG